MSYNCLFVIGPTAVGKTALGVKLAEKFNGEILSFDSRQVYVGLDIGSGKDLCEYTVPYHLIDIATLENEYNLFDFQEDFYKSFSDCLSRNVLPVCVGGTGMYIDSILRNYDMLPVKEDKALYDELNEKSYEELKQILISEKEKLHNTTEFGDKDRIIKAILINRFLKSPEAEKLRRERAPRPKIEPLVFGTTLPRPALRARIAERLKSRMKEGLIEEVESLHKNGASWARLESLGLEYRFVSEYLQGKIESREKLFELLNLAIGQFAKRQETWFRGMERKGVKINWLPQTLSLDERLEAALKIVGMEF